MCTHEVPGTFFTQCYVLILLSSSDRHKLCDQIFPSLSNYDEAAYIVYVFEDLIFAIQKDGYLYTFVPAVMLVHFHYLLKM